MAIPVNIKELLSARTVESERIEYKQGWNPDAICRTFFEVELFIHPEFEEKEAFTVEESDLVNTHEGIDALLEKLLNHKGLNHDTFTASAIAGIQAGTIADQVEVIDNQIYKIFEAMKSTIAESEQKILKLATFPQDRKTLLNHIGLTKERKNYERYMLPLVNKGWLTMTIPDKPTSPNQKYITTLKGRLILKFLKMKQP